MDDKQRLHLQKMIQANNVEDQTEMIRNLRHSQIFKNEISNMVLLKAKYRDDKEKLNLECISECNFLFTYYTDLFNKIKNDEIDLNILNKFVDVLKDIEDGRLDQHEGSFKVGTLLKELYIDSALKKAEKLDEKYGSEEKVEKKEAIQISWKQFKNMKK